MYTLCSINCMGQKSAYFECKIRNITIPLIVLVIHNFYISTLCINICKVHKIYFHAVYQQLSCSNSHYFHFDFPTFLNPLPILKSWSFPSNIQNIHKIKTVWKTLRQFFEHENPNINKFALVPSTNGIPATRISLVIQVVWHINKQVKAKKKKYKYL